MKAMVLTSFGGPEVFEQREVTRPEPGPCDLLVRIVATSANPCDFQTRRGDYKEWVSCPAIIGIDASGVVEAVGSDVTRFKVGDEVFYEMELFTRPGTFAEYNLVDESIVALKPENVSHFEAASLPLVFGTAYGCLIERAKLQIGESVLVHAGAGGVGSVAIQIAKAAGAKVFTTCSTRSVEFVESLGADVVIDYKVGELRGRDQPGDRRSRSRCRSGYGWREHRGEKPVCPQESRAVGVDRRHSYCPEPARGLESEHRHDVLLHRTDPSEDGSPAHT